MSRALRYAALGDSFTEGVGDVRKDGSVRGWADLVAKRIAKTEPLDYINLAVRGRQLAPIATDQLDAALALSPDVLTFCGGGNDLLAIRPNLAALRATTESVIVRTQRAGVRLVMLSNADPTAHLPMGRAIRRNALALHDMVCELVDEYGVELVDTFVDAELRRAAYWSADRIHLNRRGHRRVAASVLAHLGYRAPAKWTTSAPGPDPVPSRFDAAAFGARQLPLVARDRLLRSASGDDRRPKHADWQRLPVAG